MEESRAGAGVVEKRDGGWCWGRLWGSGHGCVWKGESEGVAGGGEGGLLG